MKARFVWLYCDYKDNEKNFLRGEGISMCVCVCVCVEGLITTKQFHS